MSENEQEQTTQRNTLQKDTFTTSTSLPTEVWEKRLKEHEKTAVTEKGLAPEKTEVTEKTTVEDKTLFSLFDRKSSKRNFSGLHLWANLLLISFMVSAVCGLILTLKPLYPESMEEVSSTEETGESMAPIARSGGKAGVAWIKVYGVIEQADDSGPFSRPSGAAAIAKKIREAGEDKNVKAIVLDINSPGGTVASVQNIYSEILKAKENKKVVALFRDVAASGGFYIAMAADQIVAEPGTMTGSIGVIMQLSNIEGLFDKVGVKMTPVTSGKHKDIGSPYRSMTAEEKALIQDMVDDSYSQFLAAVKAGRPNVKEADLLEYTDGRVFTGKRAYDLGFIDKLGGEAEALQLAGELAGLKDPKILSSRRDNLKEFIFSIGSSLNEKSVSKQLQSLASPRMAYLLVL